MLWWFCNMWVVVFYAAVHHRATGCSDEFPCKLVRTTVSNDEVPSDNEASVTVDPLSPFNLQSDRVHDERGAVDGTTHHIEM
jgi:hypothetical protein